MPKLEYISLGLTHSLICAVDEARGEVPRQVFIEEQLWKRKIIRDAGQREPRPGPGAPRTKAVGK